MERTKRLEIAVSGVVGAVAGVYTTAAADSSGLVIFTVAVIGALALGGLARVLRNLWDRRTARRDREQMKEDLLLKLANDVNVLRAAVETSVNQARNDVDSVRALQRDHTRSQSELDGKLLETLQTSSPISGRGWSWYVFWSFPHG